MTIYVQQALNLEFLISEGDGQISRSTVTLGGAQVLEPGMVLGMVTATGVYIPSTATAADGSQNAVAVNGYRVDTTLGNVSGAVIARMAEVTAAALIYDPSVNTPTLVAGKIAGLATQQIIAR